MIKIFNRVVVNKLKMQNELRIRELDVEQIRPSTQEALDPNFTSGGSKVVVIGRSGTGKAFDPDTLVAIPGGRVKRIKDLNIGEQICGIEDNVKTVLEIHSGVTDVMYEVCCTNRYHHRMRVTGDHILALVCVEDMFLNHTTYRRGQGVFITAKAFYALTYTVQRKLMMIIDKVALLRIKYRPVEICGKSSKFSNFVVTPVYRLAQKYFGITVSGENKMFLLGNGFLVHNCLGKDTKVRYYNGNVGVVQDVKEGDVLMGDDSGPRMVKSVCQGRERMYNITSQHSLPYEDDLDIDYRVNASHIMTVYDTIARKVIDKPVKHLLNLRMKRYKGVRTAIDFAEHEPELDARKAARLWMMDEPVDLAAYLYNSRRVRRIFLDTVLDYVSYDVDVLSPMQRDTVHQLSTSLGYNYNTRETEERTLYKLNIERMEVDDYYGFELDRRTNGRFLLGDATITHNTSTITSLLYEKRHIYSSAVVMSGTEDANSYYSSIFPSTFVYGRLQLDTIQSFIDRQTLMRKYKIPNAWSVLLLDDCMDQPRYFNHQTIQWMFKNGRHSNSMLIVALQYAQDLKPTLKSNVDWTFLMRETSLRNQEILFRNFGGNISDFRTFKTIYDEIAQDYTALVIHNSSQSKLLEDSVFWYKPKKVPADFRFGSVDYWNHHYIRGKDDVIVSL